MKYKPINVRVKSLNIMLGNGNSFIVEDMGKVDFLKQVLEEAIKEHFHTNVNVDIVFGVPSSREAISTDDIVELKNGKRYPVRALCLNRNEILVGKKYVAVNKIKKITTKFEVWRYYLSSGKTVVDVCEHFGIQKIVMNSIISEYLPKLKELRK